MIVILPQNHGGLFQAHFSVTSPVLLSYSLLNEHPLHNIEWAWHSERWLDRCKKEK